MIDRQRLRAQLSKHEDRRKFVYDDADGKPITECSFVRGFASIGVGRNLVGKGLDDVEIDFLLDHDIDDALAEAQTFRWFESLDPVRRAVIVELCFNMNAAKLTKFVKFCNFMNEHRYMQASEELKDSLWYRQVKTRGDTLIAQLVKGEWQT